MNVDRSDEGFREIEKRFDIGPSRFVASVHSGMPCLDNPCPKIVCAVGSDISLCQKGVDIPANCPLLADSVNHDIFEQRADADGAKSVALVVERDVDFL